jgi:ABC-type oligopeptide transport system substrate-binding subunit
MKKHFVLLIPSLLIMMLALAGCGGSGGGGSTNPGGDTPVTTNAELSGYVYYSVDSEGTKTTKVGMTNDGTVITQTDIALIMTSDITSKSSTSYNVKTDANGYFSISISGLADGTYYVAVTPTGYDGVIYTVTIQSGKTIEWIAYSHNT